MSAFLLALLQHTSDVADEHTQAGAGHHEPWIVEQINHLLAPVLGRDIPGHLIMTVFLMIIAVILVLLLRGRLSVDRPSKGQQLLEVVVEQIRGLLDQVIGPYGRRYVPVIGSFALFILIGNLMAQVPGLGSPTENINVTGALGLTSFLYYMAMGFRQQGFGYLKHFLGGLTGVMAIAIGWLIFVVEIISNSVRPVTLSLRLFVNMYADQQIGNAFLYQLIAPIVPIFTIVLGVFVSLIQTFIFIMLSMVYLSETVPHEEHDHEEHGHTHEAVAH
jgi:F-type H+-transporting ATPase subunit a